MIFWLCQDPFKYLDILIKFHPNDREIFIGYYLNYFLLTVIKSNLEYSWSLVMSRNGNNLEVAFFFCVVLSVAVIYWKLGFSVLYLWVFIFSS